MGEMGEVITEGRSLAETPTWSVASVTTVMVFLCLLVERSIYRFGKWLKRTRRKALLASLEKIKEELMLLGLISLLLGQCGRLISEICISSSAFNSRFYICSVEDYSTHEQRRDYLFAESVTSTINDTSVPPRGINAAQSHHCGEGREPFVSYEGLEQLNRFLFVLGITHVLYSCVTVGLAMIKIYRWKKWESQASFMDSGATKHKVMQRQTTFVFHHASHPWSRNQFLNWMLCFLRQFRSSIQKSDYLALRLGFITNHKLPPSYDFHKYMVRSMEDEFHGIVGISWLLWGYSILCIFINVHGLNIYFWLSFIPAILVMLVGTKLQHVVSSLALEIVEPRNPQVNAQVKPRDDLFWFGKPDMLLHLLQFISFQNAFEMATFIWSLWGLKQHSCFMKNHIMIIIRLASGLLVQFWCSYSTVPLNVLVSQMGSRCKKALIAESVRDSLHSWCKRVKERSKRDHFLSNTARSTCSLESIFDEGDEIVTIASGTLSPCSSAGSLNQVILEPAELQDPASGASNTLQQECSVAIAETVPNSPRSTSSQQPPLGTVAENSNDMEGSQAETLFQLFQKT